MPEELFLCAQGGGVAAAAGRQSGSSCEFFLQSARHSRITIRLYVWQDGPPAPFGRGERTAKRAHGFPHL